MGGETEIRIENVDTAEPAKELFPLGMAEALQHEKPRPFTPNMIRLYLILMVAYCCSITNGFDANTFGGILAMDSFKNYFDSRGGSTEGMLASIYVIGNMVGSLAAAPIADKWGRRLGMALGSGIAIIGIIFQAAAQNVGFLIGGRFVLDWGLVY